MATTVTVTADNLTFDLLLVRIYGFDGQKLVDDTIRLNPQFAGTGPFLPRGAQVLIPDLLTTQRPKQPVVDLFS